MYKKQATTAGARHPEGGRAPSSAPAACVARSNDLPSAGSSTSTIDSNSRPCWDLRAHKLGPSRRTTTPPSTISHSRTSSSPSSAPSHWRIIQLHGRPREACGDRAPTTAVDREVNLLGFEAEGRILLIVAHGLSPVVLLFVVYCLLSVKGLALDGDVPV